ncbi:MAG TPA: GTPase HflX [Treponemataceae bacterium]|nr:GTPase HflX [Treponemataceae bacterium]
MVDSISKTYEITEIPPSALLVGAPEVSLAELEGLVHTLGLNSIRSITLARISPTVQYAMGTGKASEIVKIAHEIEADCIIFDFEISPTQQRNWEKLAKLPVYDRQEIIIRIFAQRAQTKEASLQVELAQLQYSLPRLAHSYGDMAKQRGGNFGSKGSGETQLELDRRAILTKSAKIKKDLKKIVKERKTQRKRREKIPIPVAAIVGYTNAGKSSLLNALTSSGVFVEDKLFATLDPTTRRLTLNGGAGLLLTDTVGFISKLPHSLIDAFKSTLEEANRANLQILLLDASDPDVFNQYTTVVDVLAEIEADKNKRIIVLNKCDKNIPGTTKKRLTKEFPKAVWVSAKTKKGFDELSELITKELFGKTRIYALPLDRADLVQKIRLNGVLIEEEWKDSHIKITARISGKIKKYIAHYECDN